MSKRRSPGRRVYATENCRSTVQPPACRSTSRKPERMPSFFSTGLSTLGASSGLKELLETSNTFPVRRWLAEYDPAWIRPDLVAGLTLAAYLLPAGIGDASLAGLPPQA